MKNKQNRGSQSEELKNFWEIAAHSAYDMFPKYKYLIIDLVFPHLGFWSVNFSDCAVS